MVTCNKIPLAQHGRREMRLKLNTITLREALLAHTNSRTTKQEEQAEALRKALLSQVRFRLRVVTYCKKEVRANRNSKSMRLRRMYQADLLDLYRDILGQQYLHVKV